MHQRVGVDQFHRTGSDIDNFRIGAQRFAGGVAEQGAHAFATAKNAVTHGGMQARGRQRGGGEAMIERGFGTPLDQRHPG